MIKLTTDCMRMCFDIKDEQRVVLSYFGTKEKNYIKDPNSTFIEIETLEESHDGNHCSKHCLTPYGIHCRYVEHDIHEREDSRELVLVTEDGTKRVTSHYIAYKDSTSIHCYQEVKNISKENIRLEYVSTFYVHGLGQADIPACKDMNVHYAHNSWYIEAQWKKESFISAGLFNGNDRVTMKHFALNNTGSWSTKDYLPMLGIENERKKQFILSQIENNGSWHIEVGDYENSYYLSVSGPEFVDNAWSKVLKPDEAFQTVPATISLGHDFEEAMQELTKARRKLVRPNYDHKTMPVIFNDYMHATWDASSEGLIWPLVDIAKEMDCDEFVLDAGWFAKGPGWTDYIGEWKEYSPNFPTGGLKGTFDYIRSKGMKTGLWFEIENMGRLCPIVDDLPDSWFFQVGGKRAIRNKRNCLNFANKDAYAWAMNIVADAVERYGLDYLKIDYNLDAGVGNEYNADSLGDGLLKHNRAFMRWLEELMNRFPNLTIENCGSGGCRMDYALLSLCPIQSTSDQVDYRKYPYLAANSLTSCLPEQAAVWSYPVDAISPYEPTLETTAMNMVNAMLGRIHLSSFINKLTNDQLKMIQDGVKYWKSIADFKKKSVPVYPNGTAYFYDKDVVAGLLADKKMILAVWNTSGEKRTVKVDLRKYNVKSVKVGYPLALNTVYEFKDGYLNVEFATDYGGRIFEIELA